ncbi:hypothetical protein EON73_01945 [bacterium]|nr:MAG: hypothetical protein EON73_01945 [bacterium]
MELHLSQLTCLNFQISSLVHGKIIPLWLANLNLIGIAQESSNYKIWLLNKVWLRLLGQNFTKKRKLFFLNVWTTLLANVIPVLKTVGLIPLANRLYLILVRINLFNFDKKLNNSLFFVQLFRMRYFILKAVSKSVGENLRSLLPNKTNKIGLKYYAIREKKMTAALLTNLIIVKLGQYFRINSILYPLTRWISRHKNVLGYRIIISGRLTRRERASHMIKSGRSMPLSSYRHRIDYNQDVKIMKFGMVGIKVYLFLRNQTRNSYYFFKFIV